MSVSQRSRSQQSSEARTIFIAEIQQFGGAERSVLALSGWLYRHNLAHRVLTYNDHCNLARYSNHPVDVIELRPGTGARQKIGALRRFFENTGQARVRPLLSGYQPALHATLAGLRGFHTLMHDTPSLFSDRDTRSLQGKLRIAVSNAIAGYGLRSGGNTLVTSEYLRSECRREFGVEATVARMGGMVALTRPRIRTMEGELRMLSVSRVEANKRIEWIIRALARMEAADIPLSSSVNWRLDIVGKGSLIPALTEMAAHLGIAARVQLHGFVGDDALAAMYERAHLFLMPAIQGYGIPAIESLGRGIPVLLHRDSGVSDILLNTPWATVMAGGEAQMEPTLRLAIDRVITGVHHGVPPPKLPTEDAWAERVSTLCGWI